MAEGSTQVKGTGQRMDFCLVLLLSVAPMQRPDTVPHEMYEPIVKDPRPPLGLKYTEGPEQAPSSDIEEMSLEK